MSTESKDKKKYYTLKEDFERRGINAKSLMNVIKYSLNGVKSYAEDGKSFIIYIFCSFLEIFLGFVFGVNGLEWILIIVILGIILAVELLNTAIEAACDAITKEYNPFIKIAKDCGSGATFIIFIVAVILNIIIFLPKIFPALFY
jgi:undecaprenol kinase